MTKLMQVRGVQTGRSYPEGPRVSISVSSSHRKIIIAHRLTMSHQWDVTVGKVNKIILGCIEG